MNDIENIFDLLIKGGLTLATAATLLIGIAIWHGTRSSHMIMGKLWVLFNGDKECKTPYIRDFLDRQSAVLRFRFQTRLHNVRTSRQIDKILKWARKNDQDVGDIAACGKYFDLENPGLKNAIPGKLHLTLMMFFTTLFASAVLMLTGLTVFDRAILKMRDSGTIFTMSPTIAQPIKESSVLPLKDCPRFNKSFNEYPGFTAVDVVQICAQVTRTNFSDYITSTVRLQRTLSAPLAIYMTFFLIAAFRSLTHLTSAHAMKRRLLSNEQQSN